MAGETVLQPTPRQTPVPGTGLLATPFQFVLTGSENLQIRSACSLTGVVVAVQGRLLQSDGSIVPIGFTHTPNSDRSIATQTFALGPGTLLTLTCFALTGTPIRGQCFVQVQIIQGLTGATYILGTLIQGYVTSFQNLAWPGTPIESSLEGRGFLYNATIANPPVATGASFTGLPNTRWRLQAITATLLTDASAPIRFPYLELFIGAVGAGYVATNNSLGASATGIFSWVSGCLFGNAHESTPALQITTASLGPGFEIRSGWGVAVDWLPIGAGDQLTSVNYIVEEWLELN